MMCSNRNFVPIGDHIRKMVRTIPLTSFVIYCLGININLLMKRSFEIKIKLTCSREMVRISTRIEDVSIVLVPDKNVSTKKLN